MLRALLSNFMLAMPVAVAADAIPVLDVEASCRQVAAIAGGQVTSKDQCMAQEQGAREDLRKQWPTFSRADQQSCLAQTRMGGLPSYVELLECMVIARDARALEAGKPDRK